MSVSSPDPLEPPESEHSSRPWFALDRLGTTQALGGLAIGLIALFTSYDHITIAGRTLQLPQQWGIAFIIASVAIVFVDAELASRVRHRSENERLEARIRDDQDRDRANQERNRSDQERNRAAEARERQAQEAQRQSTDLAFLRRSALLSARVQLDPSDTNRARLQAFLSLMTGQLPDNAEP